jgi:hypothetical protein
MMKKYFNYIFILFIVSYSSVFAQKDTVKSDTLNGLWSPNAAVGINVSQISLSNWSQGGENSITWTLTGNGGFQYLGKDWNFRNRLSIEYGRTKIGSNIFRTNDNDLYMDFVLSKKVGWSVDPFLSLSVRTPVTTGYNYKVTPFEKIADFFDPGYVTESLGFTYDQHAILKTRLGFAVEETFTNKYRQYSDDPDTKGLEAFKLETGFESVTNFQQTVYENLIARSMLRLFTRFENLDIWDVRWDTSIIAKVNNLVNVNFDFLLIYQKSQSVRTQIRQTLQISFIYTIF